MRGQVEIVERFEEGVLELCFSNPPFNVLSVGAGLVSGLLGALSRAVADPQVELIILAGGGGNFSAGADITDFDGDPVQLMTVRTLFDRIENSPKPIVAAIEGLCLGGGFELALAAHYRVASATAGFGFPEISLGLLPGGGGTQRSPRLAGAANALDMMLSGRRIAAARAREMGLVDEVVEGSPAQAVRDRFAAGAFRAVRRTGELPAPPDLGSALEAVRQRGGLSLAARHIVTCVEATGSLAIEAGLQLEGRLFGELMESAASRALRHGFFGRRIVQRIPGLPKVTPAKVDAVTIVGGGLMGTGIAIALLNAGQAVTIVEMNEDQRARAIQTVEKTIGRDVEKGRISREAAQRRLAALSLVPTLEGAAPSDLYIEAIFEDMDAKSAVFAALDRVAPPEAILASNTSTLDLDEIAACTSRPESVVGMHFFSPANVMRLLEVVRGKHTSAQTLASAMAFAKVIGKTGVVAGVCDGFIGNRIFEEYLRQAWFLLEEGATPRQVDTALEDFGMAMGPCRVMDLAGQDIGWKIRQRRAVEQPDRPYSRVPDLICELGRFGQKTGAGFYLYPDGRTPQPDPEMDALIAVEAARLGLERRAISDEEIVQRCIYAMVNEGARILEEGIAYRPVDIDVIYLDGYGFPAERGGPMFFADQQGLANVLAAIRRFSATRHGWAWEPAKLLVDLVERGGSFAELNHP